MFATFAAIAMRGIQLGSYDVNIKFATRFFPGFIQIQEDGYHKSPSLRKSFRVSDEMKSLLDNSDGITGYSERINSEGLISFYDQTFGTAIFGIDPATEKNTSKMMEKIKQGKFFSTTNTNEIVLGETLARNLKVQVGDTVVVLSQAFDGSMGNLKFIVSGIIKTGISEFDKMSAFIGIDMARELLFMYNRVNAIAINIDEVRDQNAVVSYLKSGINDTNIAVVGWEELMPDFRQSIEFDNVSGIFMLLILIVIVAFGILNTVLMSITERFREFGVTLAIGMKHIKLVYLVTIETFLISTCGIIAGEVIGFFINLYIVNNPVQMGAEFDWMLEEYGFLPRIESTLNPEVFISVGIAVLAISVLAVIIPLIKVYKLEPLKGIRYT